jgi:cytoskeleton protein RodZ
VTATSNLPQPEASADVPAAAPAASSAPPVQIASAPRPTPAGSTPAAANAPTAATAAPTTSEPPPPARETRLRLELTSESWVEVYDSRGERLFYDVAGAGSVQSIVGRPPLRVVLGNAAAVAVEVDGQAHEIPSAALDGEGARFVVNRSGSLSRAR